MEKTLNPNAAMGEKPHIIIGISGASGAIYGIRAVEALRTVAKISLIISSTARRIILAETSYTPESIGKMADFVYDNGDLFAPIASGTCLIDGMIIAPCSIRTLSGVANSFADTLMVRAADVTLKQRRRLVLAVRESPLHAGHLRLMSLATDAGAIIVPPVPAWYAMPKTIDDIAIQTVGTILDLFNIDALGTRRWSGKMD